jgi:hypothetical protein
MDRCDPIGDPARDLPNHHESEDAPGQTGKGYWHHRQCVPGLSRSRPSLWACDPPWRAGRAWSPFPLKVPEGHGSLTIPGALKSSGGSWKAHAGSMEALWRPLGLWCPEGPWCPWWPCSPCGGPRRPLDHRPPGLGPGSQSCSRSHPGPACQGPDQAPVASRITFSSHCLL